MRWLRNNWLPVSSWIVAVTALVYYGFGAYSFSQLQYPYGNSRFVVYTPLMFHQSTAWIYAIVAIVLFIAYIVKSFEENYRGEPCALLVLVMVLVAGAFLIWEINPILGPLSLIMLVLALILLVVLTTYRSLKYGIAAGIVLLSSCGLSFATLMNAFVSVRHVESAYLRGQLYQLAVITDTDMDCEDSYFVLFACDSIGLACRSQWSSDSYYLCLGYRNKPFPQTVHVTPDDANNHLLVQLDDDLIEVPIGSR